MSDNAKTYTSTETLFYIDSPQDSVAPDTRLNSYASLITSARLVDAVRRDLGLTGSTAQVARQLAATTTPTTLIISVIATDTTPAGAQRLATDAGRQLVALSGSLETAATGQPAVRLVPADVATTETAPSLVGVFGIGLILGLVLGILAAHLRDGLDNRVHSPAQLIRLGIDGQTIVRIPTIDDVMPGGQVSEELRILRTILLRGGLRSSVSSLVVTSCDARDHMSSIAAALAVILSRASTTVVLVSTDLRGPRQWTPEWALAEPGLGEVLTGHMPVAEVLTAGPEPDLWLLPAGHAVPYPEDSLASTAMTEVIEDLQSRHDVVLLDAPPLAASADALSVAGASHAGILLVVVEGRTRRRQLRASLRTLEAVGSSVLAVALVQAPRQHLIRHPTSARAPGRTDLGSTAAGTPVREGHS